MNNGSRSYSFPVDRDPDTTRWSNRSPHPNRQGVFMKPDWFVHLTTDHSNFAANF